MHDGNEEIDATLETADRNAGPEEPQAEIEESYAPQDIDGPEDGEDANLEPEEQIAELKDQLLRALAEVENVRRRSEKERTDTSRYAVSGFARDVLSVADNLQRTLIAGTAGGGDGNGDRLRTLLEAVEMIERDLKATLERHGISAISPLGEKFDHNFHQAMSEVPGTGKKPGTVVDVMQTGYVIADRLLRPALVGVAKADEPEGIGGDTPADGVDTEV